MSLRQAQAGVSLLVVLMLLLASSMAALSAMTSALISQHLATNMHALTQASMAAEWGASELMDSERFGRASDDSKSAAEDQRQDCETLSLPPIASSPGVSSSGTSLSGTSPQYGEASFSWSPDIAITPHGSVSYRYVSCRYQGENALMVMGSVRDGDNILARHFLIVRHAADGQYVWRN